MKTFVVLVALVASLVHAAPSQWWPYGPQPSWHGAHPAWHGAQPVWHGPINIPVVLPSGHLADTPEVSALKHAHAVAVANTPGAGAHVYAPGIPYAHGVPSVYAHGAPYPGWHGPLNVPVVLPDGYLADTPDVVALRAAHAAAVAHTSVH